MSDKQDRPHDVVLEQALSTLTYLAVVAVVSIAIGKRDTLARLWMRVQNMGRHRDPYGAEMAAFRRDIADISRGTPGPDTTRPPGLYEREA